MRNFLRAAIALVLLSIAAPAFAQTNRLGGIVRDETGDTVRGVIVRAVFPDPQGSGRALFTLTTATDDRGRFLLIINRGGEWFITFEAPGFARMTLPVGMRLNAPAHNMEVRLDRNEHPEAFGALAGVNSKELSTQRSAAAELLDKGQYDQALEAYRQIKTTAPALSMVNLQSGNAYVGKKAYPEAEAAFQEVMKDNPEEPNGLFAMGALKEAQGRSAEAQTWYEKAAQADEHWTKPLMKLAAMASAGGDRAAATRHLTRVVEIDPKSQDGQQAATLLKGQ
jgi:tetratricopeptide (TPR) repeat protein